MDMRFQDVLCPCRPVGGRLVEDRCGCRGKAFMVVQGKNRPSPADDALTDGATSAESWFLFVNSTK